MHRNVMWLEPVSVTSARREAARPLGNMGVITIQRSAEKEVKEQNVGGENSVDKSV